MLKPLIPQHSWALLEVAAVIHLCNATVWCQCSWIPDSTHAAQEGTDVAPRSPLAGSLLMEARTVQSTKCEIFSMQSYVYHPNFP